MNEVDNRKLHNSFSALKIINKVIEKLCGYFQRPSSTVANILHKNHKIGQLSIYNLSSCIYTDEIN
jgi:hypothetical protein